MSSMMMEIRFLLTIVNIFFIFFSRLTIMNSNFSIVNYFNNDIKIHYPEDVDESVIKAVKKSKIWEKQIISLYQNYINKGNVVLDIGGYLGTSTIPFSLLVGEKGKVITFEPQPNIFALLEKTIQDNNLNNVELNKKGVYNKNGKVQFIENNTGKAGINGFRKLTKKSNMIDIDTVSIDSLNLDRIDFIKIDTEGAEWEILKGAHHSINKFKPILHIETFIKKEKNKKKLEEFCNEYGYRIMYKKSSDFILIRI